MNVLLVAQNYNKVLVYLKVLIRVKFNYLRSHLDRVKMERIEKKNGMKMEHGLTFSYIWLKKKLSGVLQTQSMEMYL